MGCERFVTSVEFVSYQGCECFVTSVEFVSYQVRKWDVNAS